MVRRFDMLAARRIFLHESSNPELVVAVLPGQRVLWPSGPSEECETGYCSTFCRGFAGFALVGEASTSGVNGLSSAVALRTIIFPSSVCRLITGPPEEP